MQAAGRTGGEDTTGFVDQTQARRLTDRELCRGDHRWHPPVTGPGCCYGRGGSRPATVPRGQLVKVARESWPTAPEGSTSWSRGGEERSRPLEGVECHLRSDHPQLQYWTVLLSEVPSYILSGLGSGRVSSKNVHAQFRRPNGHCFVRPASIKSRWRAPPVWDLISRSAWEGTWVVVVAAVPAGKGPPGRG